MTAGKVHYGVRVFAHGEHHPILVAGTGDREWAEDVARRHAKSGKYRAVDIIATLQGFEDRVWLWRDDSALQARVRSFVAVVEEVA